MNEPTVDRIEDTAELRRALTIAVRREWGSGPIDPREPYITNAAWRAVHAVLAELGKRQAVTGPPEEHR